MKGDFSRQTFDPKKHYSGVLMQQGRVQVDADWNEQQAIYQYRLEAQTGDILGPDGTPMHDNGFRITTDKDRDNLLISKGRYYVDGLLCQNDADVLFDKQPYLPGYPHVRTIITQHKKKTLLALLYLDAWQRHITVLDDPHISDTALGGADTTTRTQIAWQVKALPIEPAEYVQDYIDSLTKALEQEKASKQRDAKVQESLNAINAYYRKITCNTPFPEWNKLTEPSTGTLKVRTLPTGNTDDCLIPPSSGYAGLENQLYRVEIHHGGDKLKTITFKWSRDNGSVVTAIKGFKDNTVTVENLGVDDVLEFAPEQWVELVDDQVELQGEPGQLLRISSVDPVAQTITLAATPKTVAMELKPRLRRWDQVGASATEQGVQVKGDWLTLENGIQVRFSEGTYKTGDYWQIPGRTLTGQVEWPTEGEGAKAEPAALRPQGITHHYSRLALIQLDPTNDTLNLHQDCRRLFSSIASPAMRIVWTSWWNDAVMALPTFIDEGLRIAFDAAPDPLSIKSATMLVTLEVLVLVGLDEGMLPHSNSTLTGSITVEEHADNFIHWQWLHREEKERKIFAWLSRLLEKGHTLVRARVTLKGHAVWSRQEHQYLYLDGQAFGYPVERSEDEKRFESLEEHRKRLIGEARTHLILPSGAGARASDFESWFYLA